MTLSKIIFPLFIAFVAFSCKKPVDGYSPLPEGDVVSMQHLKTLYKGYPLVIRGDYVVKGQVLSSDKWGNFSRSIMVGDGSGAIEVKVDTEDYFLTYPVGQRVLIRCDGLTLGSYGGSMQLGAGSQDERYECGFIPGDQVDGRVVEYGMDMGVLHPPAISPGQMSPRYVNCLVRFEKVQFADPDNTWGSRGSYADRTLQFPGGETLTVTTSPEAVFAEYRLPQGSGPIEGILGYFNGEYSLRMNTHEDHDMTAPRF